RRSDDGDRRGRREEVSGGGWEGGCSRCREGRGEARCRGALQGDAQVARSTLGGDRRPDRPPVVLARTPDEPSPRRRTPLEGRGDPRSRGGGRARRGADRGRGGAG